MLLSALFLHIVSLFNKVSRGCSRIVGTHKIFTDKESLEPCHTQLVYCNGTGNAAFAHLDGVVRQ